MRTARATTRSAVPEHELIQPTPEEAANGWTAETLTEHVAQALAGEHAALMNRLFPEKPPLRVETVASFDPHRW